jgi:hypothetical protein
MAEITLGRKETLETLKVNIGKESYSIPLMGSLSLKETRALATADDEFAFFKKYIPEDVIDSLAISDLKALTEAWKEESEKASDVDLGES